MENKEKTILKIYVGGEPCTYALQIIGIYLNGKYEDKDFGQLLSSYHYSKEIVVNQKEYKIVIWNSHSSERFTNFEPYLCKGVRIVIVVYSVEEERTFKFAKRSLELLKQRVKDCNAKVILLGVKYAKSTTSEKTYEQAKQCAQENNIEFREITLSQTDEINKFFTEEVKKMVNSYEEELKPKEEKNKKKCIIF